MSKKTKLLTFILLITSLFVQGQIDKFNRKSTLNDVKLGWNKLSVPLDVYNQIQTDFSDVRIFGILSDGDTIESPYVVQTEKPLHEIVEQRIEVFDQSRKGSAYYSTFRLPESLALTELKLELSDRNFDWHIQVEGSYDQKAWYTVVEDARIVGIENSSTQYQFTKITIPTAKYKFYRFHEINGAKANILSVSVINQNRQLATWIEFPCTTFVLKPKSKSHETALQLNFAAKVPLSELAIQINESIDFVRPIEIQYLSQRIKTEKGYIDSYSTFYQGSISSYEKGIFHFEPIWTNQIKIIIQNHDNQPLNIGKITTRGYQQTLIFRTTEEGQYLLAYGGNRVNKPQYDIEQFVTKNLDFKMVKASPPEDIEQKKVGESKPMGLSNSWLWAIMIMVIALLGWFTVGMIRKG